MYIHAHTMEPSLNGQPLERCPLFRGSKVWPTCVHKLVARNITDVSSLERCRDVFSFKRCHLSGVGYTHISFLPYTECCVKDKVVRHPLAHTYTSTCTYTYM